MLSPTITRRYTPPTCSLEVVGKTSALSQWTGQALIKNLTFELCFDDPRLDPSKRLVITGDRQQLESLSEAINQHVQGFLDELEVDYELAAPGGSVYDYDYQGQSTKPSDSDTSEAITSLLNQPKLATRGLLSHTLHLGSLAPESSNDSIQLNATQLHDLAEALDAYSADMVALPSLTAAKQRRSMTRWGALAASLLLAVGVSRAVLQQPESPPDTADRPELEITSNDRPRLIPPNPNASYSFPDELPTAASELNAPRAGQQDVNLESIPSRSPVSITPREDVARPVPPTLPPEPVTDLDTINSPAIADDTTTAGAERVAAPSLDALDLGEFDEDTLGGAVARPAPAIAPQLLPDNNNPLATLEQYFQAQWQSPETLKETLEYRLSLSSQGTLQRIIPIGKAAELYQSDLEFLKTGQTITGPLSSDSGTFRLVLDPNGRVQVFEDNPR